MRDQVPPDNVVAAGDVGPLYTNTGMKHSVRLSVNPGATVAVKLHAKCTPKPDEAPRNPKWKPRSC